MTEITDINLILALATVFMCGMPMGMIVMGWVIE